MTKFVIFGLFTLALVGCASAPQTVDTSCTWVRPIYIANNDKLTPRTAEQILAHDEKWQKFCGAK